MSDYDAEEDGGRVVRAHHTAITANGEPATLTVCLLDTGRAYAVLTDVDGREAGRTHEIATGR